MILSLVALLLALAAVIDGMRVRHRNSELRRELATAREDVSILLDRVTGARGRSSSSRARAYAGATCDFPGCELPYGHGNHALDELVVRSGD